MNNELFSSEIASYSVRKKRAIGNVVICIIFPALLLILFGHQSLPLISDSLGFSIVLLVAWLLTELVLIYGIYKIEGSPLYLHNAFQVNLVIANGWYLIAALQTYAQINV